MTDVRIERTREGDVYGFSVRVTQHGSETQHEVTLSDHAYARLGTGYTTPEEFVQACFAFLLAHEPKEQILSKFDVSVIPKYFPEFENQIRR